MRNPFTALKNFLTRKSTVAFAKNVAKAGLAMFVVGALLAAMAPVLASGMASVGLLAAEKAAEVSAMSIPWMGVYFGMFGALREGMTPLVSRLFEPRQETALLTQTVAIEQVPGLAGPEVAQTVASTPFQDLIAAERATSSSPDRII